MLKELLDIYLIFFRMGAVTFGGGYAMLPILRREIVQNRKWMDEETIMDFYALSQGLPGIIAINVSVFIGFRQKKIQGAVAAALGMVSPCIVIISIIFFFLSSFQDNVYVKHALAAISVCVAALILDAVISMWKKGVKDFVGIIICFVMLGLNLFTDISPIIMIIVCALFGIVYKSIQRKTKSGEVAK
ncbi:MAG: chromate transporter [Clostridiales bacterium]|nr:chromate transporter [Clostridiales bacterium]